MERADFLDLAEELKGVSNNLSLLACVVMEGVGTDQITPKCIEDNILNACNHIDRIADEMKSA